jgi:hypothetical protein
LVVYVVLAYALAWAWWPPMAVDDVVVGPGQGWPTHLSGLLGPALAAAIILGACQGRSGLVDLWATSTR